MIAITHDQERFRREFPPQLLQQRPVVVCRHNLTANIFIDAGAVSEIDPIRCELGTEARIPWKMICNGINVQEHRAVTALMVDELYGLTEIKTVSLETACAKVTHIQIALNASRRLKCTRTEKGAVEWIE